MAVIRGNPFRGPNAALLAYEHLRRYHGVDASAAADRLHRIKSRAGLGPAEDVAIGKTGAVYIEATGEEIGSLITEPG
jgi:hypothetical protein